jgi:hypothetical protein
VLYLMNVGQDRIDRGVKIDVEAEFDLLSTAYQTTGTRGRLD